MSRKKNGSRNVGDVVAIPLGDGTFGFGRVLENALVAFYDYKSHRIESTDAITAAKVAFSIPVMKYALTSGMWAVIDNVPLDEDLLHEPLFFKKDPITKELSIYRDSTGEEVSATREECEGLECAAVWEPEHVVDRLNDHFAGRPNKWVESMRP